MILSINDTQHNNILLRVIILSVTFHLCRMLNAECLNADCRYAGCRGAVAYTLTAVSYSRKIFKKLSPGRSNFLLLKT